MFDEAHSNPNSHEDSVFEHSPVFLPSDKELEIARCLPCGAPETYGATPLDHALAYDQQCKVESTIQSIVDSDIPEGISPDIARFIGNTFTMRFYNRSSANHENYLTALHPKSEFKNNAVLSDIIERAELGHASPAELLIVRKSMGIRSAELACLSHPYGKRIEFLEVMRAAVRQSVELMGGEYFETPETRYRVKGAVNELLGEAKYTTGFFMTRKRTLGEMPDGTLIRERTSFVLRTDTPEAVPKEALDAIRKLGPPKDPKDKEWQDKAVEVGHLDVISGTLMATDAYSLVVPVSTTIYAYNRSTTAEIEAREAAVKEQEHEEFHRELELKAPALFEAMQKAQASREK